MAVEVSRPAGECLSLANYAKLVELVGPARAKEIIFTARMINAQEARQMGLADEVVPVEQLEARVRELALTIAHHALLTLQATKEAIRRVLAHLRRPEAEGLNLNLLLERGLPRGSSRFPGETTASLAGMLIRPVIDRQR